MNTDPRQDAWEARKNEHERLTMLQRQRRLVYGTYGDADGADRAQELDYLIAKSELLIRDLEDRICARQVENAVI